MPYSAFHARLKTPTPAKKWDVLFTEMGFDGDGLKVSAAVQW